MSSTSRIEWTDSTWNPVTGCTRTSPGCDHCYAERMAKRLHAMGNPRYTNGFEPTLHWDKVSAPLKWRQPRRIFVNSMSDLFHEAVPAPFVRAVFDTMAAAHWHEFQILTKRARRLPKIAGDLVWPPNVWMGVSVESRGIRLACGLTARRPGRCAVLVGRAARRASRDAGLGRDRLGHRGAAKADPALGLWEVQWARAVRDQCVAASVPFFFKQWGGVRKHRTGRVLDGRTWDEFPAAAART